MTAFHQHTGEVEFLLTPLLFLISSSLFLCLFYAFVEYVQYQKYKDSLEVSLDYI